MPISYEIDRDAGIVYVTARGDVTYGMGRMYATLAGDSFIPTDVFRSIDDAMRWLDTRNGSGGGES